ncbi:carbohydrate ABC transporter permease [Bauldia sp.]|uniref:carbohydrate ABC transporter permease n=1 Tax=Bauldia sp. TaxID=2575872 RepID=UPI003BA8CC59
MAYRRRRAGASGRSGNGIVHAAVLFLVILWVLPTFGLLVSSVRDKDLLAISGWWTALTTTDRNEVGRTDPPADQVEEGASYVLAGNLFDEASGATVVRFGVSIQDPEAFDTGETAETRNGGSLTINSDGSYRLTSPEPFEGSRGQRIFYTAAFPPDFTLANYQEVLSSEGIGQSFINSLTVAVPATVIPILIAAYAAYALAWMKFPGRALLLSLVVGLLVVPLQMSLIPLLELYNGIGEFLGVPAKTYVGIWLAHTGFGMPLAIYLLRNYIAGLPGEIMESARIDGASDFDIFIRIILPLSMPALAAFSIFQFLWVWNDLLVAMVFLGNSDDQLVLTGRLRELLGSRGGNWEILTASAFVSIIVPLIVFFSLQRFLVRGLLAGSVKG